MTPRQRAEAAQNHDINDDDCRTHGEPLYSGWCKACAAEAIAEAVRERTEACAQIADEVERQATASIGIHEAISPGAAGRRIRALGRAGAETGEIESTNNQQGDSLNVSKTQHHR